MLEIYHRVIFGFMVTSGNIASRTSPEGECDDDGDVTDFYR